VFGRFAPATREYFQDAIKVFASNGCQAVVLGCTEIPLLIQPADSVLPTLDSTRTLARAALRTANA
jgi:aspartate racemase